MVSSKAPGSGDTIGSIDETKAKTKNDQEEKPEHPETLRQDEQKPKGVEEEEAKGKRQCSVTYSHFLGSLSFTLASFFYKVDYYSLNRTFSSLLNNVSYCDITQSGLLFNGLCLPFRVIAKRFH